MIGLGGLTDIDFGGKLHPRQRDCQLVTGLDFAGLLLLGHLDAFDVAASPFVVPGKVEELSVRSATCRGC